MWNIPSKERLAKIPKLYETEHIPLKDKLIYLHFFIGHCDWYVSEYDPGDDLFWGYANLGNHDFAEWGYISFDEVKGPQNRRLAGSGLRDLKSIGLSEKHPKIENIRKTVTDSYPKREGLIMIAYIQGDLDGTCGIYAVINDAFV